MNKNQLQLICQKLNIQYPCEWPKRVYGGLLHKMWYLNSHESKFAVKQLHNKIQLTEKIKFEYELTEEIAFQFSQRDIPAIPAIKIKNHYLIFAEESAFLAYPWIAGEALKKDTISEMHAVKIAAILARIHRINLNVPELDSQKFNIRSNEEIISLIDQSISRNLIFKEHLKKSQEFITDTKNKPYVYLHVMELIKL